MSKYFSECSKLKLLPIDRLARYWQAAERVEMISVGGEYFPAEIPGTIAVKCQQESNGVWTTQIDFESVCDSPVFLATLQTLTTTDVVAIYTDQRNQLRVAGSPDYPLSLTLEISGAVVHGRLDGESDAPHGYIAG